jgi:hypothetical protein
MKLAPVTYRASQFTWTNGEGVSEASDLRVNAAEAIPGSQIWDDAADYGFEAIGKNDTSLFLFVDFLMSRDGDEVDGWKYISSCGRFKITILND